MSDPTRELRRRLSPAVERLFRAGPERIICAHGKVIYRPGSIYGERCNECLRAEALTSRLRELKARLRANEHHRRDWPRGPEPRPLAALAEREREIAFPGVVRAWGVVLLPGERLRYKGLALEFDEPPRPGVTTVHFTKLNPYVPPDLYDLRERLEHDA